MLTDDSTDLERETRMDGFSTGIANGGLQMTGSWVMGHGERLYETRHTLTGAAQMPS